jgi:hypothetical protein
MKKSMTAYLYALTEDSYDDLYDIISTKYRKFKRAYQLLKEYSDNIIMLKYKEKTEKDKLKITVTFASIDVEKIANKLRSQIIDSDEVYIEVDKNDIDISIHGSESDV